MIEVPILRGYHTYRDLFKWCLKNDVLIAGGYARYMASKRKHPALPSDVDLYVSSQDILEKLFWKLTAEEYTLATETDFIEIFTPVSWANKEFHEPWEQRLPIHVIKPLKKPYTPEELIKTFDIRACCFVVKNSQEVWADAYGYCDEGDNKIVFQNYTTPLHDMQRLLKYIQKGYTTSAMTYLKIMQAFAALENPTKVIEEHISTADHEEDMEAYLYFIKHFRQM